MHEWTFDETQALIQMMRQNWNLQQIADAFGFEKADVADKVQELYDEVIDNSYAESKVSEIKRLRHNGYSNQQIAIRLKISVSKIEELMS